MTMILTRCQMRRHLRDKLGVSVVVVEMLVVVVEMLVVVVLVIREVWMLSTCLLYTSPSPRD